MFLFFLNLLLLSFSDEFLGVRDTFYPNFLGNLKDLLASLCFFKSELKIGIVDPWAWELREFLTVYFIDLSDPVQLAEVFFHFDVGLENFLLGENSNGSSESFSSFFQVIASQTKIGIKDPQLSKSKFFVGHQFDGSIVDFISL